jgi:hypothetical protein
VDGQSGPAVDFAAISTPLASPRTPCSGEERDTNSTAVGLVEQVDPMSQPPIDALPV